MHHCNGDSSIIKDLKSVMHDNLNFRYANLKETLYLASVLDPRFKTLPFASVEDREDTFMRLITETVSLDQAQGQESDCSGTGGSAPTQEQSSSDGPSPPKTPKGSCALLDLLGAWCSLCSSGYKGELCCRQGKRGGHQIQGSSTFTSFRKSTEVVHEGEYPLLSEQAKCYLCSRDNYPSHILTAKRNCPLPEHVYQLLFLHKNYKL